MDILHKHGGKLAGALISLSCSTGVHSEGLNFGVDAGVGESDNVTLVSKDKTRQTLALADFDFSLKEKGARLDEDVVGSFSYIDFLQHAYGSEFLGRFNGVAHYAMIPGSLTWTMQDTWGQAQISPFVSLAPNNQENVNYFAVGPDWYSRLGSTTFLDIGARYANANYQTTPIGSNRVLGNVQLGQEISSRSNLSLNGSVERILFTNTSQNTDYDLDSLYAEYSMQGARTSVSLSAGVSRYTEGGHSNSGSLASLQFTRKLSSAATLLLQAGRQLTDTSGGFGGTNSGSLTTQSSTPSPINSTAAPVSSSPYIADYFTAGWNYERGRAAISLKARWEKDHYVNQSQFDGSRDFLDAKAARQLTRSLSAELFGTLYHTTYNHDQFLGTAAGYADNDGIYGFGVTYRPGRALELRLRYDHLSRSISSGAGQGYGENRVVLTIGYRPQALQ